MSSLQPVLVYVDNKPVYVPRNSTVINACDKVDVEIPRFCYHDLLEIAGNCRMCLVEIEKSPKPMASCGLPVIDQIRIYTNTPLVKKAREGVLEFLLMNHPLDCPICDQGGECDLQNQAITYGNNYSRFYNYKRSVEDKNLGPLIKTIITRCIHCTRCVRFGIDVAGFDDLGTSLRGNKTEITTYVQKTLDSEVSINIVDLCPVGALTSKVYAFKARPWEVKTTKSIDTSDSLGSNITIDTKRNKVLRVSPRANLKINLEWLSDIARYTYEGNTHLRLALHYFKEKNNFKTFSSYTKVQKVLTSFLLNSKSIKIVVGRNLDLESLAKVKFYARKCGMDLESETFLNFPLTFSNYLVSNKSLDKVANADACFLVGINPRFEATLSNILLRNRFKNGMFTATTFGVKNDLTFKTCHYGTTFKTMLNLWCGKHFNALTTYKNSLLVYGNSLTLRNDGFSSLFLSRNYLKKNCKVDVLSNYYFPGGSNSVGKAALGFNKLQSFDIERKTTYLLKTENDSSLLKETNNQIIFENTHNNLHIKKASFVLPIPSVLEKTANYINYSGIIQENKSVIRFGFDTFQNVQNIVAKHNHFCSFSLNKVESESNFYSLKKITTKKIIFEIFNSNAFYFLGDNFKSFKLFLTPIKVFIGNMYTKDVATKYSQTLAKVSINLRNKHWVFV
jgi:NADH-quinone oxidoreductase chain G